MRAPEHPALPPADLEEVARLYGLRQWVEQGYKQVKQELGWADFQVRADRAIRRHWALVCGAFAFCWWADSRRTTDNARHAAAASPIGPPLPLPHEPGAGEKWGAGSGSPPPASASASASGSARHLPQRARQPLPAAVLAPPSSV